MRSAVLALNERWYARLLAWSVALGIAGGTVALAYAGVTGLVIDRVFGDPTSGTWSGEWWWILVVPAGALAVVALRRSWNVADDVPGATAIAHRGWVEPTDAVPWVLISAVSLMVGASLGPSFGVVVAGGGLGAFLIRRSGHDGGGDEVGSHYSLTGMAGGLGGIFSAPLFATILGGELSSIPKRDYVQAFIPQFSAATCGYLVYFGVTGAVMLEAFGVPDYEFAYRHFPVAVVLGILSMAVLVVYVLIDRVFGILVDRIGNPWATAALGGLAIGAISYALPLTATGGSDQLAFATGTIGSIGTTVLAATLIGKMIAVVLSLQVGFLGGTVFPMLFIGGTSGILVHQVIPEISAPLAVAAMIAAVPGATIGAPASFILIGVGGVGVGVEAIGPVGIAVLTSYVGTSLIRMRLDSRRELDRARGSG